MVAFILAIIANQIDGQKLLQSPYRFTPYEQFEDHSVPRQNDKFLQKSPSAATAYRQDDTQMGFLLDEELAPNGVTHGGFGYLDTTGDLIYVEYEKNPHGQL